ncbi:MAG: hypothetical protein Q7R93_01740 [bacterium]|nr:hypothetical protein [bacterium]
MKRHSSCPPKSVRTKASDKKDICRRKGHRVRILHEGDAEVADICSDYCGRCGHRFTRTQQQSIRDGDGIYTETLHAEMMEDL